MNAFEHLERVVDVSGWPMKRIVDATCAERDYILNERLRDDSDARTSYHVFLSRFPALRRCGEQLA